MNNDEKIISLIDGALDSKEAVELEEIIHESPELSEDKLIYEKIISSVKLNAEIDFKNQLDGYLKDYLRSENNLKPNVLIKKPFLYFAVAASFLLCLFLYNLVGQKSTKEQLIEGYQVPMKLDSAIYTPDSVKTKNKIIQK